MPELPEVETVVRGLRPDLVGRTITSTTIHWSRTIDTLAPHDFAARLAGQQVSTVRRRAKFIVCDLTHDVLLVHLRMTGRLYIVPPDEENEADRWLRVTYVLDDGRELRFSDMRKFGRVYLVADELAVTGKLGPEPLSDAFTLDIFRELVSRRSGKIKPLLLNQAFIAGVGNIYADEALWRSEIQPERAVDTLKPAQIESLYHAIRKVLNDGIEHEGASINWYRKADGTEGKQQQHFNVYGRGGEPCPRCGAAISKITVGQRGTHFCAHCQR